MPYSDPAKQKTYGQSDAHKLCMRRWRHKAQYGLSLEQLDILWEAQNGTCAICRAVLTRPQLRKRGQPDSTGVVDHDHVSGRVRGILCQPCNRGLGHFKDSLELLAKASEYLKR